LFVIFVGKVYFFIVYLNCIGCNLVNPVNPVKIFFPDFVLYISRRGGRNK
jgi:hypothetical protein